MYTFCRICFVDDGSVLDVAIKATEDWELDDDDYVFFYGLSEAELRKAMEEQTVIEGEWQVMDVYGASDDLFGDIH